MHSIKVFLQVSQSNSALHEVVDFLPKKLILFGHFTCLRIILHLLNHVEHYLLICGVTHRLLRLKFFHNLVRILISSLGFSTVRIYLNLTCICS
jgi:hypothetical protein